MFKCDKCNRKFKTKQALGGHALAHNQKKADNASALSNPEPQVEAKTTPNTPPAHDNSNQGGGVALITQSPATETISGDNAQTQKQSAQPTSPNDEPDIMETIREYKKRGLSAKQIKDVGYNRRTVDQVFFEGIVPEGVPEVGEPSEPDNNLPMVIKDKEVISTEALLRRYTDGSREDELKLRGKMELWASILMAKELVNIEVKQAEAEAKRLEPFMKLITLSREELDAAAARARGSNLEIAETAAEAAAVRIASYIDQKIPKAPPPKNMDEVFARPVGKLFDLMTDMMVKKVLPQAPDKLPQEWDVEDVKLPSPGLPLNQKPAAADTPRGAAQGWTEEEKKESGEDV